MQNILIIDDDTELCDLLTEYLKPEGFACHAESTAHAGMALAAEPGWELVILDVMLPGANGLEVLRELRATPATKALPVLMLTARGDEVDRVVGLELGADDYLAKPFSARELLARIRAILRRSGTPQAAASDPRLPWVVDDLQVWASSLRVTVHGANVEISAIELRLLEKLLQQPGTVIEREHLYRSVLGHASNPFDRSLDMHISRIRKKLGPRPDGGERIRAVRGEGYVYLFSGGTA